jgi:hypothetical protein
VLHHSSGQFSYEAKDIHFEPGAVEKFARQLGEIRAGKGERAELNSQSCKFGLHRHGSHMDATILIHERVGELAMRGSFYVDYEMFVERLYAQTLEFAARLRSVAPSGGW